MAKKLYVGNLSYGTTEDQLRTLFSEAGEIAEVALITDRDTGRSKGFGFVEMGSAGEAEAAIAALNGRDHDGRALTVSEAKPRAAGGGRGDGERRDGQRRS